MLTSLYSLVSAQALWALGTILSSGLTYLAAHNTPLRWKYCPTSRDVQRASDDSISVGQVCSVDWVVPKGLGRIAALWRSYQTSVRVATGVTYTYGGLRAAVIRSGRVIGAITTLPVLCTMVNVAQDAWRNLWNTIVGVSDAIVVSIWNLAFDVRYPGRIAISWLAKGIRIPDRESLAYKCCGSNGRNTGTERVTSHCDGIVRVCAQLGSH